MVSVDTKHILVIRLSAMGDVAMTVPVLLALTERYPSVKITVLTKEFFAPIVSSVPGIAVKVAAVKGRHKGLIGLWRLFRELRELQLDAVADLHNVMRSNVLKLFFQLSGIPFKQIKKGRKEKRALTKWEEKTITPLKTTHERYADVFRALGFAMELRETHVLSKSIRGNLKDISFDKAKKWVGIAPFAAFDGKMYPSALMEAVLMKLSERTNLSVLLFGGGEAEKNQLEVWSQQFQNCTTLVGKFTFPEELAVISSLDLMVSMDSGNAHLAAMYGVPTVTLWGVTHPYAGFYPYAQPMENALLSNREKHPYIPTSVYGNKFPEGYEMVMETIDPKRVIEKINTILGVAP